MIRVVETPVAEIPLLANPGASSGGKVNDNKRLDLASSVARETSNCCVNISTIHKLGMVTEDKQKFPNLNSSMRRKGAHGGQVRFRKLINCQVLIPL